MRSIGVLPANSIIPLYLDNAHVAQSLPVSATASRCFTAFLYPSQRSGNHNSRMGDSYSVRNIPHCIVSRELHLGSLEIGQCLRRERTSTEIEYQIV